MAERDGFAFYMNVVYENLICSNCQIISHYISQCKREKPRGEGSNTKIK